MPDTTHHLTFCGSEFGNAVIFPDTKLQTLDRRVGKDQLYFDKDQFARSLDAWNGIPVIFQKDGVHPDDFGKVSENPAAAAEEIGGRLVGRVMHPRIVIPGGPRLMAQLKIDHDEDGIVDLWRQGRLFPSTAFTAESDGDRITGPPEPNHVLLFPIKVDTVLPGDYGAFVNTLEVEKPMEQKTESIELTQPNFYARVKDAVYEVLARHSEEMAADAADEPAADTPDYAACIAEKDAEIASLKAQIADLTQTHTLELGTVQAELETLRREHAQHRFTTLLNALPVGMTATDTQRAALRQQFDAGDIEGLLLSVLKHTSAPASQAETEAAGTPFVNTDTPTPYETVGDLNQPRRKHE